MHVLALIVAVAVLFGCNSAPGTGGGTTVNDYYLEGAVVIDPNLDSTRVSAIGLRNDTLIPSIVITIGNDTLVYDDTLYAADSSWFFAVDTARHFIPGTHQINFADNNFSRSVSQVLPDALSITSLAPFNRLIQGNESATIEWNGRAGYTSYVVAVIKADSAFIGRGWCSYSQTFVNAATVPPDAFLGSDGLNPDTGLYNLYIYGIVGSPDSALSTVLLPVDLPSQLADNVSQQRLHGHVGVVSVSLLDTIRVVQQP